MAKFMSKAEFLEWARKGETVGVSREDTYDQLKRNGWELEGDPNRGILPPPPQQPKEKAEVSGIGAHLEKTAQSAGREIGSVLKTLTYYTTHPKEIPGDLLNTMKETVKVAGQTAIGGAENIYQSLTGKTAPYFTPEGQILYPPQGTPEQQVASAVGQAVSGVIQHPIKTFEEHPLSTLSLLAPAVGQVGKLAGLPKIVKVAEWIDPFKVPGKILKPIGDFTSEAAGTVYGTGKAGITEAIRATPEFREAIRGDVYEQARKLADDAHEALDILSQQKRTEYLASQAKLKAITKEIAPEKIGEILRAQKEKFGISKPVEEILGETANMTEEQAITHIQKLASEEGGKLSPLVKAGLGEGQAARKIGKAINYVRHWDEFTPDGLDRLQKSLRSLEPAIRTPESAFINGLVKDVQKSIEAVDPQYATMLRNYHEASDTLEELRTALEASDPKKIETTVRKITQALKPSNIGFSYRNKLLQKLEEETGVNIAGRAAGIAMKAPFSRGAAGALAGTALVSGQIYGLLSLKILPSLVLLSPRAAGEVLLAIGVAKNKIGPVMEKLQEIAVGAGRIAAPVSGIQRLPEGQ